MALEGLDVLCEDLDGVSVSEIVSWRWCCGVDGDGRIGGAYVFKVGHLQRPDCCSFCGLGSSVEDMELD